MYKLLSLLTFYSFAQISPPFIPVSPINITIDHKDVIAKWEILEEGYEYKLEILKGPKCNNVKISFPYTLENNQTVILPDQGKYCWRLKYRLSDNTEFNISESYSFTYMEDSEKDLEEDILEEVESPLEKVEIIKEEIVIDNDPPPQEQVMLKEETQRISIRLPKEDTLGVSIQEENHTEVLGKEIVNDNRKENIPLPIQCNLTYDKRIKEYVEDDCNLEFPNITGVDKYEIDEEYDYILIEGELRSNLLLNLTILDCEQFSLFKPSTWFKCNEVTKKETSTAILLYSPRVKIKGKKSTISMYNIKDGDFLLRIFSEKLNQENICLTFDIYFYINTDGDWIDFRKTVSKDLDYSMNSFSSKNKPLMYIFDSIIGVTQWHGYTDYASPHTGIDFGSVREPILSPADGTIYAIGWDDYYGECNSGGKYLKIKHENGMYTVYMHLESSTKSNDKEWKVGEKIKKGDQIGISGNTGSYNCQPLGYHLHYELRENSQQSSHMDPVPYTDINWDLIPTINWQTYPGRLTGDNPHPNF